MAVGFPIGRRQRGMRRMLKLRKMKKKDYAAVEHLMQQLQRVHIAGRPELYQPMQHCLTEYFFESLLTNEDVIALLAEDMGAVVGVCIVSMLTQSGSVRMKTAYVDELVVDEPHRRTGIGSALLAEAERLSRKRGAKRLDLMVWSFNETAISVYEKYGMTPQRIIYEKAL